jgi:predicted MFS family arabinose efflux permease
MLGTLSISMLVMKVRVQPKQKRKIFDMSALKELPFMLFSAGGFFIFMGLYIPFFYVQSYAVEENIMGENAAFYMLSIMNGSSFFGRIIPNYIADRAGPLNVLIPTTISAGAVALGWIGVKSTGGLVVFCILYGFFSGGFVSLPPTVLVTLSPNLNVVGTRMGMSFAMNGLGLLIGTPVAGQLVANTGFVSAISFCGALVAFANLLFIGVRVIKVGLKIKVIA